MPVGRPNRRLLWVACALVAGAGPAIASAQVPGQPYASYWSAGTQNGNSILNWNPLTDPDAAFNRGSVPLATRISNPYNVNPNARVNQGGVTSLVAFGPTSGNPSQGSATQNIYAPGFWQYTNTMVFWGGSASEGSILAPNGTVIDAAHRNGARILGNVFLPPTAYGGSMNEVNAFLQKDGAGHYLVADKMIQAARYYGFDGWFINQETSGGNSSTAIEMQNFLKYVKAQAPELHVQWYDAMNESGSVGWQGALNNNNDAYFDTDAATNSGKVSDSMFVDFRWSGSSLDSSGTKAASLGRSKYELYAGVDFEANRYGIAGAVDTVFGNDGNHRTSLGLYRPEYTYNDSDKANRADFYARDSVLWVGQNGDPSNTTTSNSWKGIANYVPAMSTVIGTTFATNFNKGTGDRYMINGQQLATGAWNNLGLQDVEPTYQWIVSSTGSKLTPSFSHTDAYNGGTSLLISGTLNATNDIKLYQTQVSVAANSKFKLVLKPSQANPLMKLAISFTDAPDTYTYIDVPSNLNPSQWNSVTLDLGAYAGKTIENVGLRMGQGVSGTITNYSARLGQFVIYQGTQSTPAAPTAPTIDSELAVSKAAPAQVPLRLHWTRSTDQAYVYNLYRRTPTGTLSFVGATPNDAYYVPGLTRLGAENFITLELETVGMDFGTSTTRTTKSFYVDWSRPKQTLTYQGAPGTVGGSGTWDVTNLNWNSGPTAPANQYWSNNWNDTALFTGTPGTVIVNAPVTVGGLTFASDGFTLTGSNAITLSGTINVTNAADTATISAPLTAGVAGITKAGAGTLKLTGNTAFNNGGGMTGGTIAASAELWVGNANFSTFLQSAGDITVDNWLAIGRSSGGNGIYRLTGGTLTKNGTANDNLILGALGATGVLNQTGGTVTVNAGNTVLGENGGNGTYNMNGGVANLHDVVLSFAGTGNGTVNLNNGTLNTSGIRRGNGTGSANFFFNGGTLVPTASTTTFLQGITTAAVLNGANINTNGFDVTIAQPLVVSTGFTGGLTKQGAGTLTLSGVNTYVGATTVNGGTLWISTTGSLPATSSGLTINGGTVRLAATTGSVHHQKAVTLAQPGAILDVGDNGLSIDYAAAGLTSPATTILGYLRNGANGGTWTGTSGILSSVTAGTPGHSLAFVDDGSSVQVTYAYAGDANLDGKVNFDDLLTLAKHYGQTSLTWTAGNFDYDAADSVGFNDLLILAKNYNAGVAGAAPADSQLALARFATDFAKFSSTFGVDANTVISQVPEPVAMLTTLLPAAVGAVRRRRC